ncbi:TatD family hydrolase [Granulosicoccus sp. 3-233]|uniref:TatD family hydrolase n=1 Tax=Granulosicoccus sp. 3-233 TaxID=3417969 RepID=UPI003D346E21
MSRQPTPALIDSHVHTDDQRFASDRSRILQSAREANIIAQIVPAISQRLWPRTREICAAEQELYACYGLHPCFCDEHDDAHLLELSQWLGRERPVAVGECGLDYFIADADKRRQQHLFSAQLAMAREFDLPIVIHARKAVEDVIRLIRASGHQRGVVHSFNGSAQQADRLIDLGYYLSFGGAVTYDRATRLRELVSRLPLDALLLETDAPDQADAGHAGQRNEPAYLLDVWQSISAMRPEDPEAIAHATTCNAIDLFRLPLRH